MTSNNKTSYEIFREAVATLAGSQGYYSRLNAHLESLCNDELEEIEIRINDEYDFKDLVDVIMALES